MRMKRFLYCAAAIIMALMVIFAFVPEKAGSGQKSDKAKDYNEVYELLHLSLPRDAVRLSEQGEHDNFHGDGYRLLVFQLSPAGQENLMQQSFFASWSQLPMDSALQEKLESQLQTDRLTEWVDLEETHGYYVVLSKNYSYVINGQNNVGKITQANNDAFNMNDDLWRNISFAVLDTYQHKLIIFIWDS